MKQEKQIKNSNDPSSENKLRIAVTGLKKETIISTGKYSEFINFLRKFAKLAQVNKELSYDKIKTMNLIIISGPRQFYKQKEIDALKKYLEEGGSLYIALGEGGSDKNNTNLNDLLEDYGISFANDSVVRTSYSKYLHPKECFIEDGKFHEEFSRTVKVVNKKRKIMTNDDLLDAVDEEGNDDSIKVVYPYGCSLNIKSNKISTVFNSGMISYPLKRPLMVAQTSLSKKGKIIVVGSEKLVEDEYFFKEDNSKIVVSKI